MSLNSGWGGHRTGHGTLLWTEKTGRGTGSGRHLNMGGMRRAFIGDIEGIVVKVVLRGRVLGVGGGEEGGAGDGVLEARLAFEEAGEEDDGGRAEEGDDDVAARRSNAQGPQHRG